MSNLELEGLTDYADKINQFNQTYLGQYRAPDGYKYAPLSHVWVGDQNAIVDKLYGDFSARVNKAPRGAGIGLPTGRTQIPFYQSFDSDLVAALGYLAPFILDEVKFPGGEDERSHEAFMQKNLLADHPSMRDSLYIPSLVDRNPEEVFGEFRDKLNALIDGPGIELVMGGVGPRDSQHFAFISLADDFNRQLREVVELAQIDDATRRANAGDSPDTYGDISVTIGAGVLMKARAVYQVAFGLGKSDSMQSALLRPFNREHSTGLVHLMPVDMAELPERNFYMDTAAASGVLAGMRV